MENRHYDVAAIGSITIDLNSYTSQLPMPNQILIGNDFSMDFGGIAANQAYMASLLGSSTVLLVQKGEDLFGQCYSKYLAENKIKVIEPVFTQKSEKKTAVAQIMSSADGNSYGVVVDYETQYFTEDVLLASQTLMKALKSSRILIVSLTIPFQTIKKALREAFAVGTLTILNAAPVSAIYNNVQCIRAALTDCHAVVINESELAAIFERSNDLTKNEIGELLNMLYDDGCQCPIVTLAEKGAMFRNPKNGALIHILAPPVDAVDSIGAGDCFIGSLAHLLAQSDDGCVTEEMVEIAVHLASSSVKRRGTQKSYPNGLEIVQILSKFQN